ncbi:cation:dicarboxylate symporter family transporter, partial [Brachyspira hyodysenteriae]
MHSLLFCSIATLSINLEASEKIGVSEDVRNIVLPIGATAHMDGTC